jgi:hypothetical protein
VGERGKGGTDEDEDEDEDEVDKEGGGLTIKATHINE